MNPSSTHQLRPSEWWASKLFHENQRFNLKPGKHATDEYFSFSPFPLGSPSSADTSNTSNTKFRDRKRSFIDIFTSPQFLFEYNKHDENNSGIPFVDCAPFGTASRFLLYFAQQPFPSNKAINFQREYIAIPIRSREETK